jgi:hypothetical protein
MLDWETLVSKGRPVAGKNPGPNASKHTPKKSGRLDPEAVMMVLEIFDHAGANVEELAVMLSDLLNLPKNKQAGVWRQIHGEISASAERQNNG